MKAFPSMNAVSARLTGINKLTGSGGELLYLKSLEIQGFKSFPDKISLTFDKGLTAVVGPNGSGKSNIGDSVRWVLGEQSTKTLRGNKMEDVIFSGTVARKPMGFAAVTLNIDNSDNTLPDIGDEVAVTRKLYRSGESEYLINGKSCRLKDINELFMDTGLGRDGYSIIGQGRIAEIVGAKSSERRDIFEEAAGISKFRYKKLEAERKLTAAQENLLRLTDIVEDRGVWLTGLEVERTILRLQDHVVSKLSVEVLKLRYSLFHTVFTGVGGSIDERAPHDDASVGSDGFCQHIGTVGMGTVIVEGTWLSLGIGFHQKSAEVGNQRVDLLGLGLPPGFHLRVQRVGGFQGFPSVESLGGNGHGRGEVHRQIDLDTIGSQDIRIGLYLINI